MTVGEVLDMVEYTFYSAHAYARYVYASHLHLQLLYYSSQYQSTALHFASKGGHHETVRVLLERGADSNSRNEVSGV